MPITGCQLLLLASMASDPIYWSDSRAAGATSARLERKGAQLIALPSLASLLVLDWIREHSDACSVAKLSRILIKWTRFCSLGPRRRGHHHHRVASWCPLNWRVHKTLTTLGLLTTIGTRPRLGQIESGRAKRETFIISSV